LKELKNKMQITTAKLRVLTEQLISHSKKWYPSQPLPRGTRGGYKDRLFVIYRMILARILKNQWSV
jgi:hypothetical protein